MESFLEGLEVGLRQEELDKVDTITKEVQSKLARKYTAVLPSGSTSRGTAVTPLHDVDLLVVLPERYPAFKNPEEFIKYFSSRMKEAFGQEAAWRTRCVKVKLEDTDVDLVPVIKVKEGVYRLADKSRSDEDWPTTEPHVQARILAELDHKHKAGGRAAKCCRLVKAWNRTLPEGHRLGSYDVERLICQEQPFEAEPTARDYNVFLGQWAKVLKECFERVKECVNGLPPAPYTPDRKDYLHKVLAKAVTNLEEAVAAGSESDLELLLGISKRASPAAAVQRSPFPPTIARKAFFAKAEAGGALDRATALLKERRGEAALLVLHGMGGVGKTATAEQLCRSQQQHYKNGIYWLDAEAPVSSFATVAKALQRFLGETWAGSEEEKQERVRESLGEREGWLLVVDNADRASDLAHCLGDMQVTGHVVVTSRRGQEWWQTWYESNEHLPEPGLVEVERLPLQPALELLLSKSKTRTTLSDAEQRAAERLVGPELLDGLPLAIGQAGAMIARKHFTLSAYCTKYEELETALFQKNDSAGPEAELHDFLVTEVADDVDGEAISRCLQGKVKSLRGLKEMTDEEVEALELQECEKRWLRNRRRSVSVRSPRRSVRTTWLLTLLTLEKTEKGRRAVEVLQWLAWLSPDDIFVPLLEELMVGEEEEEGKRREEKRKAAEGAVEAALGELAAFSLVAWPEGGRVHRVLQDAVRRDLALEEATPLVDFIARRILQMPTFEHLPRAKVAGRALARNCRRLPLTAATVALRAFVADNLSSAQRYLEAARQLPPGHEVLHAYACLHVAFYGCTEGEEAVAPALEEAANLRHEGAAAALLQWKAHPDPRAMKVDLFHLMNPGEGFFASDIADALRSAFGAGEEGARQAHARRAVALDGQWTAALASRGLPPGPWAWAGQALLLAGGREVEPLEDAFTRAVAHFAYETGGGGGGGGGGQPPCFGAGIAAGVAGRLAALCPGREWGAKREQYLRHALASYRPQDANEMGRLCLTLLYGGAGALLPPLLQLKGFRGTAIAQEVETMRMLSSFKRR